MYAGRQAFTEAMCDEKVRKALRHKVRAVERVYDDGEQVYFLQKRLTQGDLEGAGTNPWKKRLNVLHRIPGKGGEGDSLQDCLRLKRGTQPSQKNLQALKPREPKESRWRC